MLRSRINNIPRLDFPDRRSDLEACNSGETEKANSTALFFQDLAIFVKNPQNLLQDCADSGDFLVQINEIRCFPVGEDYSLFSS